MESPQRSSDAASFDEKGISSFSETSSVIVHKWNSLAQTSTECFKFPLSRTKATWKRSNGVGILNSRCPSLSATRFFQSCSVNRNCLWTLKKHALYHSGMVLISPSWRSELSIISPVKHTSFLATHLQGTISSWPKRSVCNRMLVQTLEATRVTHFGAVSPLCRRLNPHWGNTGSMPQSRKQKRQFSLCFLAKGNSLFTDNTSWRSHCLTSHPRSSSLASVLCSSSCAPRLPLTRFHLP